MEQKIAQGAKALAKVLAAAVVVVTTAALAVTATQGQAALQGSNRLAASRRPTALPSRSTLAQGGQERQARAPAAATALVAA